MKATWIRWLVGLAFLGLGGLGVYGSIQFYSPQRFTYDPYAYLANLVGALALLGAGVLMLRIKLRRS